MLNPHENRKHEFDIIPESEIFHELNTREKNYRAADIWELLYDKSFTSAESGTVELKDISASAIVRGGKGELMIEVASEFPNEAQKPSGFGTTKAPNWVFALNTPDGKSMTDAPILHCWGLKIKRMIKRLNIKPTYHTSIYGERVKDYRIPLIELLKDWLDLIPIKQLEEYIIKRKQQTSSSRLKELHRNKKK